MCHEAKVARILLSIYVSLTVKGLTIERFGKFL